MSFISERLEARRAGNIDRRKVELENLNPNFDEKKIKRIAYLNGRDEKLNQIAERKAKQKGNTTKIDQSTHENNLSLSQTKTITKKQGLVEAEVNIGAKNQKAVKSKEPTKTKKK